MSRPRTEDPKIRRVKILDAARDVMIRKGYQDFVVKDVAENAGVASGTLYLYFKDKMDLFAAVFMDLLDRMDARIVDTTDKGDKPGTLRRIAHEMLSFIDEHQDFLFQFTGEHPALSRSPAGVRLKNRYAQHLKLLETKIREAMKRGQLGKGDTFFVSLYFSFLTRTFMIGKILTGSTKPLSDKTDELMDLFLHGAGR